MVGNLMSWLNKYLINKIFSKIFLVESRFKKSRTLRTSIWLRTQLHPLNSVKIWDVECQIQNRPAKHEVDKIGVPKPMVNLWILSFIRNQKGVPRFSTRCYAAN